MEQIIYGITIVIYAIFIIRFILSWIGGDFDLDMDVDGDLDLGDVVSFKGVTHFLMGFFSWLSTTLLTTHTIEWYDYILAFILGLVFVAILFYIYRLMMELECKPTLLTGKQLIGQSAKIYLYCGFDGKYSKYLITVHNGVGTIEIPALAEKHHDIGDMVTILDYQNSYYYI